MTPEPTQPAAPAAKELIDALPLRRAEQELLRKVELKKQQAGDLSVRAIDPENQDAATDAATARRLAHEAKGMETALEALRAAIGPVVCILSLPNR